MLTATVICFSLAKSVSAQLYRRPRRTMSSVVAGAIVAGIALLFVICIALLIMRRFRARRAYTANTGLHPPATSFGKPLFGGPWGRNYPQSQTGPFGTQGIHHQAQGSTQAPLQNHDVEQNLAAPPPAYSGHDGRDGKDQSYAPPSGPPPNATAKEDHFVGGFRT